jgi:hypothetical protein
MTAKRRTIEVDARTADVLEAQAAARGQTVSELLADLVVEDETSQDLESLRRDGLGPWSPEILAEDARRAADFQRTGEGIPWKEVRAWMKSWGKPNELPPPKPRKL